MIQNKKVVWLIRVMVGLLLILFALYLSKEPSILTINGSYKAVDENTDLIKNHVTFDEMDATYYVYFSTQPTNAEDHGTFKKLEDDLYIMDGGVFDGKLVRLYSNHMNIIDQSGVEPTIRYEKISDIPILL